MGLEPHIVLVVPVTGAVNCAIGKGKILMVFDVTEVGWSGYVIANLTS